MASRKIGRYTVTAKLGSGAMATVYRAHDPHIGRQVAIKVLHRQLQGDEIVRRRFLREAKTIARLDHPAIVPIYDAGRSNGRIYIVMRLMEGGNLDERIKRGPLPLDEIVLICERIGSALDTVHRQNIVHRDIKPENILFDHFNQPFLADFGIVKLAEAEVNITRDNLVGTPAYMSPEQVQGSQEIDGRSDLYAMGIVLFEMLSGMVPYKASTAMGTAMQHVTATIPRINKVNNTVPGYWQKVIKQAMAKDKRKRFQSGTQFATAVRATARKQKERASRKILTAEQSSRIKRLGASIALLLLLSVGVFLLWNWLSSNNIFPIASVTPTSTPAAGLLEETAAAKQETVTAQQLQSVEQQTRDAAELHITATAVAAQLETRLASTYTAIDAKATESAAARQTEATRLADENRCLAIENFGVEILGEPTLVPPAPYIYIRGNYLPPISASWLIENSGICPWSDINLRFLHNSRDVSSQIEIRQPGDDALIEEVAASEIVVVKLLFEEARDTVDYFNSELYFVVGSNNDDLALVEQPHLSLALDEWIIVVDPSQTPTVTPALTPTPKPKPPPRGDGDNGGGDDGNDPRG